MDFLDGWIFWMDGFLDGFLGWMGFLDGFLGWMGFLDGFLGFLDGWVFWTVYWMDCEMCVKKDLEECAVILQ